ncbi:MAG: hypothetical protein ACREVZ_01410 [Burkholderiales bacterium]
MNKLTWVLAIGIAMLGTSAIAQDPAPMTPGKRVAILIQWLKASQAQLRSYEWIETTVITKGGEEKSRKQNTCYYGVEGTLQKVPVAGGTEAGGGPPGILIPGKIVKKAAEKKKKELMEYMQNAAALAKSYVPPDPERIQQVVNSGNFSVNMLDPNRRVQLAFRSYLKSGDQLSIDMELPTNRLLGMHISSYLETAEDAVQVDVAMGVLQDGTIYAAKTTLDAKAKEVVVTIENTGHHRVAG